jgi:hypothetical protein
MTENTTPNQPQIIAVRIGRGEVLHASTPEVGYPMCGASANRVGSGVSHYGTAEHVTCRRCLDRIGS